MRTCPLTPLPLRGAAAQTIRFSVCLTLVAGAALASGCGTGRYDERLEKSTERLMYFKPFRQYLFAKPTPIDETGVSLQIPTYFGKGNNVQTAAEGSADQDDRPYTEPRMQPDKIRLPGFRFAYERYVRPDIERRTEYPVYMYFAVVDGETMSQEALIDDLKEQIATEYPEAKTPGGDAFDPEAPPAELKARTPSPDEDPLVWKQVSMEGSQSVFTSSGMTMPVDGRLELFVHTSEEPAVHVIVGVRAPIDLIDHEDLLTAVKVALGTVTVEPREETDEAPEENGASQQEADDSGATDETGDAETEDDESGDGDADDSTTG